jgi:Fur family zinc uptake transcriptional regulator
MLTDTLPFAADHDHQRCIDQALTRARQLCRQRRQRLTPVRELVLQLIWRSHRPLGAYDLLPALAQAGFNSAPPTVYRALEFLRQQGLVHRIASLNAFIGCPQPEHFHRCCFLICRHCRSVSELDSASIHAAIEHSANPLGFQVEQESVEVTGLCPNCQQQERSDG